MVTACATVSPSASQTAAEKSIPSRTTVECAVRKIVVAISSAIDASALPTISCVTGRRGLALGATASRSSTSAPSPSRRAVQPAARRRSCRTRRPAAARARGSSPSDERLRTGTSRRSPSSSTCGVADAPGGPAAVDEEERRPARRAERGEPQRADLDRRARLVAHAVQPLVLGLEAGAQGRERGGVDRRRPAARPRCPSSGRRSARRRSARHSPPSRPASAGASCGLELGEERGRPPRVAASTSSRQKRTSWNSGRAIEQAGGAEQAGERRHDDGADAELLGQPGGVHRPGAAVGDQRELARVAALLGGDGSQRAHHAGVRDPVNRRAPPRGRRARAARPRGGAPPPRARPRS